MNRTIKLLAATVGLAFALVFGHPALAATPADRMVPAQAMVPPTGIMDARNIQCR